MHDPDKRLRIRIRQRFEKHTIDDAEDGGGAADANAEHQDRSEDNTLLTDAARVAQILFEIAEQ